MTSSPSVLLLTTYPIIKPRHGGQIRARALADVYRSAGFRVSHLAVVDKGGFRKRALGALDIEFPTGDPRWFIDGTDVPGTNDLRAGAFVAGSEEAYQRALSSIPERVDVFHLEQPWLLPLVRRLRTEARYASSAIVYGSQNIEAPLREGIFKRGALPLGAEVVARVHAVETEACRLADLSLAVSASDHETLQRLGARAVLRAPNGTEPWKANSRLVARWARNLKARRVALFVGSAHPPNIEGFIRAFGDALGCVPPDCRIVVAGGVGRELSHHYQRDRFSPLNRSRLEITGQLDDDDLAALKTLASVFLLPVFDGGGSNIKTAEAVYSGKPIIATSMSMRGYEAYLQLPEITIADTREDFQNAVRKALSPSAAPSPSSAATTTADRLRAKLLWRECLAAVPAAVRKLLPTS